MPADDNQIRVYRIVLQKPETLESALDKAKTPEMKRWIRDHFRHTGVDSYDSTGGWEAETGVGPKKGGGTPSFRMKDRLKGAGIKCGVRSREIRAGENSLQVQSAPDAEDSAGDREVAKQVYFHMDERIENLVGVLGDRKLNVPRTLLVMGPPGSGKSQSFNHIADEQDVPYFKWDCGQVHTVKDWFGQREVSPDKGTYYVESELSKALQRPGIVLLDELNRVHPSLHNPLYPLLDGHRKLWRDELGDYVVVHENCIIVSTVNIGFSHTGTFEFDSSMVDRFSFKVRTDYLDAPDEIAVLVKNAGINEEEASQIVHFSNEMRKMWKDSRLNSVVSHRTSLAVAALLNAGMMMHDAVEYAVVQGYSEEGGNESEVTQVRQLVTSIFGQRPSRSETFKSWGINSRVSHITFSTNDQR